MVYYLANGVRLKAFEVDEQEAMREYVRGRLSLTQGVERALFEARFGAELPNDLAGKFNVLAQQGLLERQEDAWRPTLRGLFAAQNGGVTL